MTDEPSDSPEATDEPGEVRPRARPGAGRAAGPGPGRRWKLLVAYDGRTFAGWQRQANGLAVQEVLETAVERLFGEAVTVHGASRTDAGVHALGQAAHFDEPAAARGLTGWSMQRALNAVLPGEVRVRGAQRVKATFHAQFSSTGKRYRYRIYNGRVMLPLEWGRAWHVPVPLDVGAMRRESAHFLGTHDFYAFSVRSKTERSSSIRTMWRVDVLGRGPQIAVVVEGDGFLFRMVRSMVGALVRVGHGREAEGWIGARLKLHPRPPGIITAPAEGLYLERVLWAARRG